VQAAAAAADQKRWAGSEADKAQLSANGRPACRPPDQRGHQLDNYRRWWRRRCISASTGQSHKRSQGSIDQLAASVATTKDTSSRSKVDRLGGHSEYNYDLSQRRANAVIQYLAAEKSVPAYKIYLIGLGKDKPVESNATRDGAPRNRRVDIRLMTNTGDGTTTRRRRPRIRLRQRARIRRRCKYKFILLPGDFAKAAVPMWAA